TFRLWIPDSAGVGRECSSAGSTSRGVAEDQLALACSRLLRCHAPPVRLTNRCPATTTVGPSTSPRSSTRRHGLRPSDTTPPWRRATSKSPFELPRSLTLIDYSPPIPTVRFARPTSTP